MDKISFPSFQLSADSERLSDYLSKNTFEALEKYRLAELIRPVEHHLMLLKERIAVEEVNAEEVRYGLLSPLIFHLDQSLSNLKKWLDTKDEIKFSEETASLAKLLEQLSDELLYLNLEGALTRGSSQDKALNFLFNSIQAQSDEDTILEVLAGYKEHFKALSRDAKKLIKAFERFPAYRVDLENLLDKYEEAKTALAAMEKTLQAKKFSDIERYVETLGRFSDLYFEVSDQIEKAYAMQIQGRSHEETAKACPRCQAANIGSAWTCKNCSFLFPQFEEDLNRISIDAKEGEIAHGTVIMTVNLKILFDAVEDLRDREIGEPEFLATVEWMEKKAETGIPGLESEGKTLTSNQTRSMEDKAKFQEIHEAGKAGLLKLKEGLSLLRSWRKSGSDDDLLAGMNACQEGTGRIYEAQLSAENFS